MTWREEVIGDCRLINADCREVLPGIEYVDALVTDPPYGIGADKAMSAAGGSQAPSQMVPRKHYDLSDWDSTIAQDEIDLAVKRARWAVVFGGNYYSLPPTSCWLVWDKMNGDSSFADCEVAWTNLPKAVRLIRFLWNGMLRRERDIAREHPTQKPVDVMKWAIEHIPFPNRVILDPFMGSGTTGVACVKLGRSFIGIEREEKYFDIACRRIEEAYRQPDLFVPRPEKPEQLTLDVEAAE